MSKVDLVNNKSSELISLFFPVSNSRFQLFFNLPSVLYKFAKRIYLSVKTNQFLFTEQNISSAILQRWNIRIEKTAPLSKEKLTRFLAKTHTLSNTISIEGALKTQLEGLQSTLNLYLSDFYKEISKNQNLGLESLLLLAHENSDYLPELIFQVCKIGSDTQLKTLLSSEFFNAVDLDFRVGVFEALFRQFDYISIEKTRILADHLASKLEYVDLILPEDASLTILSFFFHHLKNQGDKRYIRVLNAPLLEERNLTNANQYRHVIAYLLQSEEKEDKTLLENIKRGYRNEIATEDGWGSSETPLKTILTYFEIFNFQYSDFRKLLHYADIIYLSLIKYTHVSGLYTARDHFIRGLKENVDFTSESVRKKFISKLTLFNFGPEILSMLSEGLEEVHSLSTMAFDAGKEVRTLIDIVRNKSANRDEEGVKSGNTVADEFDDADTVKLDNADAVNLGDAKIAAYSFCSLANACELNSTLFEGKNFWSFLKENSNQTFLALFKKEIEVFVEDFAKKFGWNEIAIAHSDLFESPLITDESKYKLWLFHFNALFLNLDEQQDIFNSLDFTQVLKAEQFDLLDQMLPLCSNEKAGYLFTLECMNEEKALYLLKKYPEYSKNIIEYNVNNSARRVTLFFIAIKEEWYGVLKYIVDLNPESLLLKGEKGISLLHFSSQNALPVLEYFKQNYSELYAQSMAVPETVDGLKSIIENTRSALELDLASVTKLEKLRSQQWLEVLKLKIHLIKAASLKIDPEPLADGYLTKIYHLIKSNTFDFDILHSIIEYETKIFFQAWLILCPDFKTYLRGVVEEIVNKILEDEAANWDSAVGVWRVLCEVSHLIPHQQWLQYLHTPYSDGKTLKDILAPLDKKGKIGHNILSQLSQFFFVKEWLVYFLFPMNMAAKVEIESDVQLQTDLCKLYWKMQLQPSRTLKIHHQLEQIIEYCIDNDYKNTLEGLKKHISGLNLLVEKMYPSEILESALTHNNAADLLDPVIEE
ncbi:MAG: hypothetical protein WC222_07880 [Parachlamydiales bacterium]|jgi:hypothetical protein